MEDLNILYLCERNTFLTRTSRGRFHAVEAIAKRCHVLWSGPGWDNWDNENTLDENISHLYQNGQKPDFIFCYKPYTVKGFSNTSIPTAVSYMEMGSFYHPISYTIREILENRIDLVFCYHQNEMRYPEFKELPCVMVHNPHCVEVSIFKDYHLPKDVDVLLVGAIHPVQYPLRARLAKLIAGIRTDKQFSGYRIGIWPHAGKRIPNASDNRQMVEYAKGLNQAKICLTCSGAERSRYAKYAEIPACRSLLMADLPGEDHSFFKQFMAIIDMAEPDEAIKGKILYFLTHDKEREELAGLGYNLTRSRYSQEHYADIFIKAVSDFLAKYHGQKLPYWKAQTR